MAPDTYESGRFETQNNKESIKKETKQELAKLEKQLQEKFLHNPLDQVLSPEERKYFNALNSTKTESLDRKNDIVAQGLYTSEITLSTEKESRKTSLQEILTDLKNKLSKKYKTNEAITPGDKKVQNIVDEIKKYIADMQINTVNSDVVAMLQVYLNARGIKSIPGYAMGNWNQGSDAEQYLDIDGIIGPHTLNALMKELGVEITTTEKTLGYVNED